MLYDVTYQIGGEERTDRVDAPDAATASSVVREAHAGLDDRFELLLVHLIEDGEGTNPSPTGADVMPADA